MKPEIIDIYPYRFSFGEEARDQNDHVNNVEYVRALQEAAIAHTAHNGWGVERLLEHGWSWVVRSHRIEYIAPCQPGEEIVLLTWVHDFRRIRSDRRYRFIRVSDGKILADASTDWIFINIHTGRPVAIPPEILSAYIPLPDANPKTLPAN